MFHFGGVGCPEDARHGLFDGCAWLRAGVGVEQDLDQALVLLRTACDYGDPEACYQFAEMHDIEITVIDNDTRLPAFKDALRWNEVYYGFRR